VLKIKENMSWWKRRYSHRYREALVVSIEQSNKNCWELTIGRHADRKVNKHALLDGEIRSLSCFSWKNEKLARTSN
jgi:hypothetical protein